jgi:hypothetical protein
MKTLHITGKNENQDNMRERLRLGIILTGIITAIICLLALLYETRSVENDEAGTSRLIQIPKIVKTDFSVVVASKAVVSAVWPF